MTNRMTNEKAIALLKEIEDEYGEPIEMAIESLQERGTCKNVGTDYAECDQFACSECGIELQDWHSVERCEDGEIIFHEYTLRYCPHCGRKIEVDK